MSHVQAVHPAYGQIDALQLLLANVVGLMLATSPVVPTVELRGQASFRIKQVRGAQEATVEVEYRVVYQRPRQPGLELVEDPEP